MKKINKYLWAIAGIGVFVICMLLFVGGIEDQINNVNKPLIDNKTNISSGDGVSEHENMKPKGCEIEIKLGAKVDVEKEDVPKEKFIEAIAKGEKKVSEEDIIEIANEYNISVAKLKDEIIDAKNFTE